MVILKVKVLYSIGIDMHGLIEKHEEACGRHHELVNVDSIHPIAFV